VTPGEYAFSVGTAGSATLVLQTVLPALLTAPGESALVLEGGTHNPLAPPYEFLVRAFLPLIHRMGPVVKAKLDRHGFYPAGGGRMRVTIEPSPRLARLDLPERGELTDCRVTAVVANLPRHIAERELKVLKRELNLKIRDLRVQEVKSQGPGNVVFAEIGTAHATEVFSSFGERGVRAEVVALKLANEVRHYMESGAAVGRHLADQLLLPMALAGGGSFTTLPLSSHALTSIEVLKMFLTVEVRAEPVSDAAVRIEVKGSSPPKLPDHAGKLG
jgi:RNA 3'-terminal phosphate cyclase (ATP)